MTSSYVLCCQIRFYVNFHFFWHSLQLYGLFINQFLQQFEHTSCRFAKLIFLARKIGKQFYSLINSWEWLVHERPKPTKTPPHLIQLDAVSDLTGSKIDMLRTYFDYANAITNAPYAFDLVLFVCYLCTSCSIILKLLPNRVAVAERYGFWFVDDKDGEIKCNHDQVGNNY